MATNSTPVPQQFGCVHFYKMTLAAGVAAFVRMSGSFSLTRGCMAVAAAVATLVLLSLWTKLLVRFNRRNETLPIGQVALFDLAGSVALAGATYFLARLILAVV